MVIARTKARREMAESSKKSVASFRSDEALKCLFFYKKKKKEYCSAQIENDGVYRNERFYADHVTMVEEPQSRFLGYEMDHLQQRILKRQCSIKLIGRRWMRWK